MKKRALQKLRKKVRERAAQRREYLPDEVLEALPTRLRAIASRDVAEDYRQSLVVDDVPDLESEIDEFLEDIRRALSWNYIPHPDDLAKWIYVGPNEELLLKYTTGDFKIRFRRWEFALIRTMRRGAGEDPFMALESTLEETLAFPLRSDRGRPVSASEKQDFGGRRSERVVAYVPEDEGTFSNGRFRRIDAVFNGKVLAVALEPVVFRRRPLQRSIDRTQAQIAKLRKRPGLR